MRRDLAWWRTFEFDEEARVAFSKYDGGDFLDIGAATGAYSVVLAPKARPSARFVALEPDTRIFPNLLRTLATLSPSFPDITFVALQIAAGDGKSVRIEHPLGPDQHPRFVSNESSEGCIQAVTVDSVVAGLGLRPTFVKIDVEGAELGVLRGMRTVLEQHRPTLLLETHPGMFPDNVTQDVIAQELRAMQYGIWREIDARHQIWVPNRFAT